jgi:hypothetical protein
MQQKKRTIATTITLTYFLSEPSFRNIARLILKTSPDHIQSGPALFFFESMEQARAPTKTNITVRNTLMPKDIHSLVTL